MLDFLKKRFWPKKPNEAVQSQEQELPPITIDDIDPVLYQQLEKKFYENFEIMKLYQPLPDEGMIGKIIPYVAAIFSLINFFILLKHK